MTALTLTAVSIETKGWSKAKKIRECSTLDGTCLSASLLPSAKPQGTIIEEREERLESEESSEMLF